MQFSAGSVTMEVTCILSSYDGVHIMACYLGDMLSAGAEEAAKTMVSIKFNELAPILMPRFEG